ncbi:HEAT repeat domain-containing protein [Alkalihalobacillus sp. AL-G]|uniref:HEAT repeat domain-containing protein n=1 Tax=Alkalihalobacillus sp. AL-G TaxID=2926399 RepID=UPI00272B95E3|nr:HEAT repeat domain-containing protein [Alkalihalobacillus sp. AL-G]WLD93032.1 HEAT repeat domain-containing protein [Alkalihalobacillus sp. AL-G]
MNLNEAVDFLKENQPLPDDRVLETNSEILEKFNEVRKYFLGNPNLICIPLFINSFGNGSGFGIYQLIEDVLLKYSPEQVIPHLIKGLNSEKYGIKYWSTQIASSFPDKKLIEPLAKLLTDKASDVRYAAIVALAEIDDKRALDLIKNAQKQEEDTEVLELIEEVISNLKI